MAFAGTATLGVLRPGEAKGVTKRVPGRGDPAKETEPLQRLQLPKPGAGKGRDGMAGPGLNPGSGCLSKEVAAFSQGFRKEFQKALALASPFLS